MLELVPISDIKLTWNDEGTKASPHKVSLYKLTPPEGAFILGDIASRTSVKPEDICAVAIRDVSLPNNISLLAPPVDYVQIWNDKGTGAKIGDLAVWKPTPPVGYVSLGVVFTTQHNVPPPKDAPVRCVHESCVTLGDVNFEADGSFLWCDRGSGAKFGDISFWGIRAINHLGYSFPNTITSSTYERPATPIYVLLSSAVKKSTSEEKTALDNALKNGGNTTNYNNQTNNANNTNNTNNNNNGLAPPAYDEVIFPVPDEHAFNPPSYNASQNMANLPIPQINANAYTIPFTVNSASLPNIFTAWKKKLWFTSSAFTSCETIPTFQPVHVPFYLVSADVEARYCGQVRIDLPPETSVTYSYSQGRHGHHGGQRHYSSADARQSTTYRSVWRPVTPGLSVWPFRDSANVATTDPVAAKFLNSCGSFHIDTSITGIIPTPGVPIYGPNGNVLEPPVPFENIWPEVRDSMNERAHNFCEKDVISSQGAASANLAISCTIRSPIYRLVYFPFYQATFVVNKDHYRIFVNGQSGECTGQRSYGLGALGAGFARLGSFISGSDEEVGIQNGSELNLKDNSTYFRSDRYYIVLPASGMMSTGWATLTSRSNYPIELQGYRRDKKFATFLYLLGPGQSVTFNYNGHCCVAIISGNQDDINIKEWSSSGGTGTRNLLGLER